MKSRDALRAAAPGLAAFIAAAQDTIPGPPAFTLAMMPSCFMRRGRPARITIFLDEGRLESGMVELAILPGEHIPSMDWIPGMGQLRIYTKHFIERLGNTRLSLSPLVYP